MAETGGTDIGSMELGTMPKKEETRIPNAPHSPDPFDEGDDKRAPLDVEDQQQHPHEKKEREDLKELIPGIRYAWNPAELHLWSDFCLGLKINPVVFFLSLAAIWWFVGFCAADPESANDEIAGWQEWIVGKMSWLYIGSVGLFGIFDIYLMCSKYGDVVLGKEGEPPRFSSATWFAMLFSAGIGIGLFFYGVAEPIFHYTGDNRWAGLPRFERAIMALNVSWFHWGLAPSACYCIVGLPLAFLVHRKDMPVAMRVIFYPLMGESIYGIIGDLIDISAVIGTMFGVATSLGLGVMQISTGLNYQFSGIKDDFVTQGWVIWIVTIFATVSVMTGLDVGIRRISEVNFILGLFVLGTLFLMGNTWYLLDLLVEVFGNHIWTLTDLEFHTDPYAKNIAGSAQAGWMSSWTIFYWGWWISWAPFVGVFIAQISQGRTIREFILGNMFVPTFLTSFWFIIYGGLGLEMEMNAEMAGIGGNYYMLHSETFWTAPTTDSDYDGPNDVPPNPGVYTYQNLDTGVNYDSVRAYDPSRYDYAYNKPACNGEECRGTTCRLSCRGTTKMLWDVIWAYPLHDFIGFVTLIAIVTYFVTSSDSGSHVIDMLCANGDEEPPILQRIFWAVSEGAVAYNLLDVGGDTALQALQTASIAAGFPFCILMIGMVLATWQLLQDYEREMKEKYPNWPEDKPVVVKKKPNGDPVKDPIPWNNRLLQSVDDVIADVVCCANRKGRTCCDFWTAVICPCIIQDRTNKLLGYNSYGWVFGGICFFTWNICQTIEAGVHGFFAVGWMFYFAFCIAAATDRAAIREHYGLIGNSCFDFFQMMFFYPFALLQTLTEVESRMPSPKDE